MSALDCWRQELRALIPRGFLRRDIGDSLFISDYPAFSGANPEPALHAAGYVTERKGTLALIDGSPEKYRALLAALPDKPLPPMRDESLPLYGLAARLLQWDVPLENQPLEPLRLTLKLLDAGDWPGLARQLPPMLALLQRQKAPLPTAVGRLILNALWEQEGEEPC